ncbi:hypothetical protein DID96_31840 [Burkholderia sp. Bp8963]|nr:hypothetical protein DID96_31840 [Burkholderia sp. Bp8963]
MTAASTRAGGTYLNYRWPHLGKTTPAPLIGYVQRYEPWGWIIIASAYVDDIDAAFMQSLVQSSLFTLAIAAALIVSVAWSTRGQRMLGGDPSAAAEVAARIASGDLMATVDVRRGRWLNRPSA